MGTRPHLTAVFVCDVLRASIHGWAWIGTPSGVPFNHIYYGLLTRSYARPPSSAFHGGINLVKHEELRMTSHCSLSIPSRDTLDRLSELSERLVALSMIGANQRSTSIPEQFNEAYFDQMTDISSEVHHLCRRLDEDLNYLIQPDSLVA